MAQERHKKRAARILPWALWVTLSLATALGLAKRMVTPEASREVFLPGKTTHGHYQIELSCGSCHNESFEEDDFQEACVGCHEAELERAQDSHPETKFTDPRNADRVAELDARLCVTCHAEHAPDRTHTMGLSLPEDYCYKCHQDIGQERESHLGLPFGSCADAGCHNFHDNRALYEEYLVRHGREATLVAQPLRPVEGGRGALAACPSPLRKEASAGDTEACAECHGQETDGWLAGRHGMRLAVDLPPMTPGEARLPMHAEQAGHELSCGSCHSPQGVPTTDPTVLQIEACLGCHADEHSQSYQDSRHYELWLLEQEGRIARGSGVTCATCHLPRLEDDNGNLWVQHNQNDNLRPNEKMIRSSCGSCHGLPFSIDALADPALAAAAYSGAPSAHVKSVDWALARE